VQSLEHPEARKQSSEIDTDKAGRTFDKVGRGSVVGSGHSLSREVEAHEHEAIVFTRELAGALEEARNRQAFDRLVLVAEPGFLGLLRNALSAQTSKLVTDSLTKDLAHLASHELPPHLGAVLPI
jgi:protein required for attachment to host cells